MNARHIRKRGRERLRPLSHVDLLVHLLPALDDGQPTDEGTSLLVRELECFTVADPQVDTTSARIHPEEVAVPKLVAESAVKHAYGYGDERPAMAADVCAGATCAYRVVVCHVDIEDQFA